MNRVVHWLSLEALAAAALFTLGANFRDIVVAVGGGLVPATATALFMLRVPRAELSLLRPSTLVMLTVTALIAAGGYRGSGQTPYIPFFAAFAFFCGAVMISSRSEGGRAD